MAEITLTLENKVGLHARPAATLVKTAKGFQSKITIVYGEKQADAKSILGILKLGAERGAVVTLRTEGADAEAALAALAALVRDKLGEPE